MSDGGHIPRYNGATGSVTGVSPELLSKYQQEATEMAMGTRMQFSPDVKAVVGRIQAAQEGSYLKEEQKQMLEGSPLRNKMQDSASMVAPTASTASAAYDPTENLKKLAQTNARYTTLSAPKNAEEAAMLNRYPALKPAAKKDDAADKALVAAPAPQVNLPTGGTSVKQAQDLGSKFYDLKGIEGKLEQAQMQERQDIANEKEARAAKLEAFNKAQGPAMAGYEKLLKSEEMQDATDKEKAGLMSLMKGFLAMAAGESPNAATNIAKGAMVGMGDYGDALKEFKKSAKERNKAMAEIENARRAEAKGDLKDAQIYEDKANDYMRASKQSGIKAIIDATGKSSEISAGLYKSATDNAAANARTMAQINAPSGIERIVDRMARDPKFAESYKNYASIVPEAKGSEAELQAYLKNPMLIKATNPELAAYYDQLIKQRRLQPTSTPTGQVLVGQ
jgi:hypothetical protein